MSSIRTALISLSILTVSVCYSADELPREDGSIKLFSLCGKSTGCLVTESVVFAPIFPWFLYPLDTPATPAQLRRFQKFSGVLDFFLLKANDHYSGYGFEGGVYKKWFGLDFSHDTYNNGDFDQSFYNAHLVLRPFPRKHFQPKLMIGWKYINTDRLSGGGLHISFFNYDINFSRRFIVSIVNYLGWIKGYTIVEGVLGIEYYVYPTISIKAAMDLRHVFSSDLYGMKVGLSIKL